MPVTQEIGSALAGPPVDPVFAKSLNQLAATARVGHRLDNKFFNPSNEWLPCEICGEAEYVRRVLELRHKRYYGKHVEDNAGVYICAIQDHVPFDWYNKVKGTLHDARIRFAKGRCNLLFLEVADLAYIDEGGELARVCEAIQDFLHRDTRRVSAVVLTATGIVPSEGPGRFKSWGVA
jgi:hypothetical protein